MMMDWNPDLSGFPAWQRVVRLEESRPTVQWRGNIYDLVTLEQKKYGRYSVRDYALDTKTYGYSNHWPTRAETKAHRKADCKAVATAEYFDLLERGVRDDEMYIAVVDHGEDGLHAVLVVRDRYVLSIMSRHVQPADEYLQEWTVIYRINRLGWNKGPAASKFTQPKE